MACQPHTFPFHSSQCQTSTNIMGNVSLSLSAVRQILSAKATGFEPGEEEEMIMKIEETAKKLVGMTRPYKS